MKINSYHIALFVFIGLPLILIMVKVSSMGYSYRNILPRTSYEVIMNIDMESFEDNTKTSTWLPTSNERQNIYDEVQESSSFGVEVEINASGKRITWISKDLGAVQQIRYRFNVLADAVEFSIDSSLVKEESYHPSIASFLQPSATIQSNHPRILKKALDLVGDEENLLKVLWIIFDDVSEMGNRPFKGLTDALTALKLGEASCNGKSRLFVALCRNRGIPARLAGGLIMESGSKKTSHQWAEVYIGGFWVPFDALNNHFASIPSNYLELYKGDYFLFAHSPNIRFDYQFNIKKEMVSNPRLADELGNDFLNSYLMWTAFEKIGIPLSLLKIILLMPLGAMVVAIARNVIGMKTFGVFLPALIAVAVAYTGIVWGMLAFVLVIILVSILHFPLERLGMLYTPKLVIMLVSVVIAFVLLSIIGIRFDYSELAYITLFPVVVITITAERFARTIMEEGFGRALGVTGQTLIVVLMAYVAMNSSTMEALFLAFPELFFVIIGAMLLLGRWMGLRVSEYRRFRWLA